MGTNQPFLIFVLYGVLYAIAFILFFITCSSDIGRTDEIQIFKKTLYGGLYHFQCPSCKGVFAVKESMYKAKGKTILTCPDCGHLGRIKSNPPITIASIPKKKSRNVLFKCLNCGESLRIWAEGTDLYPRLQVYSCPYCGKEKRLRKY